jgi:hypothetical protein
VSDSAGKADVPSALPESALAVLEGSFDWYARAAARARIGYRGSEIALLLAGALIPAAVAFTSDQRVPAALGVLVVVLTGFRQLFRWHEDWLRFTEICMKLRIEHARYDTREAEYAGDDRDQRLVQRVRELEAAETTTWSTMRLAKNKSDARD